MHSVICMNSYGQLSILTMELNASSNDLVAKRILETQIEISFSFFDNWTKLWRSEKQLSTRTSPLVFCFHELKMFNFIYLLCELWTDVNRFHQVFHVILVHLVFGLLAQHEKTDAATKIQLRSDFKYQSGAELLDGSEIVTQSHLYNSLHVEILPSTFFGQF